MIIWNETTLREISLITVCIGSRLKMRQSIIWVDDLITAASIEDQLNSFKEIMKSKFNMKDQGKLSYFDH